MTQPNPFVTVLIALTLVFAAGCSDSGDGSAADTSAGGKVNKERASAQLKPADKQLAAIYNRSCRSCHTISATRSPLTGDAEAWKPRLEKGMPTLVDNVVNGFGGMPPFGLCMDCNEAEFEALINFMATGQ